MLREIFCLLLFYSLIRLLAILSVALPSQIRMHFPDLVMSDIKIDTEPAANPCPGCLKIPVYNSKDVLYFAQLYVGKNTTFRVLLATGSENLWLPTPDCQGCPRKTEHVCKASESCIINTMESVPLSYLKGSVRGNRGSEMVGFTPDAQVNYPLVWVNEGRNLDHSKDYDGWIGLGNFETPKNFIDLAFENKYIQEKVFSFHLDHNPDLWSYSNSSYLAIGYIPEDKVNKLTWIPVTTPHIWSTTIKSFKVGDTMVDVHSYREVLIDVGTSTLVLPGAVVRELRKQLKDFDQIGSGDRIWYHCDAEYLEKYPNMTVRMQNMEIILNVYTYLDFGQTIGLFGENYCKLYAEDKDIGTSIFGNIFLRNNLVVFSKRNQSMGIYQEYRPIVLPKATDQTWFIWAFNAVATVIFVWRAYKKRENTSTSSNQEQKDVDPIKKNE